MRRALLGLLVVSVALIMTPRAEAYGAGSSAPAPIFTEFCAILLQSNETPPVPYTGAYGSARLLFDPVSRQLRYEVRASGIVSATAAHIHRGAIGVAGPVVFDLLGQNSLGGGGVLTGSLTLSSQQVSELYSGNYYVNVHTANNPAGELRGQVFPREVTRLFRTQLTGANEVPPVASAAVGEAVVRLNDTRTRFDYELTVTGIPSATAAHIHAGPLTGTGGVVWDLLGNKTLAPGTSLTGTLFITETVGAAPLTGTNALAALFNGGLYVNVHTVANPGGELRGQLGPPTVRLATELSGANERPTPVVTEATGRAVFDLSVDSGQLDFEISVTGIPSATLAHLHEGPVEGAGPPVVDLLPPGGTLTPDSPLRGTVFLTPTQISKILSGQYYVNVHTVANPGGEVRGQLFGPQKRFLTYQAALSGANEVPPVASPGSGRAAMTIGTPTTLTDTLAATPYRLDYRLVTKGLTATVTLAHIHGAPAGQNGPVIFDLLQGQTLTTTLTGTLSLDDFAFDSLSSGFYYVNVHTATNPGGELRGQLFASLLASSYFAALKPGSEVPPRTAEASGSAELTLDLTRTRLSYAVAVSTSNTIVAAHIHRGAIGENGPILYTLSGSPTPASGLFGGATDLQAADLNDLVLGYLYVNVHTNVNPGGEVRGQIFGPQSRQQLPLVLRNLGLSGAAAAPSPLRAFALAATTPGGQVVPVTAPNQPAPFICQL